MKNRHIVLISLLFIAAMVGTAEIVNYQLTGNHLFQKANQADTSLFETTQSCSNNTTLPTRPATNDPQLKALGEYESACQSVFVDDMMLFTNMPISVPTAEAAADAMAIRLQAFKTQGIRPIVIMEPDSDWGLVDFHEYANGDYDAWIDAYFKRLKAVGIDDSTMGLWIPFPEPQQPFWNNSTPDDFAISVNRYFTLLRASFPTAKTGILLDSQAGEEAQGKQLLSYVRLIDNSLVDVAGLQGFPWDPADVNDPRKPLVSASDFAPADIISEVAKSLDTDEILINTGTYRHKKMDNGGNLSIPSSKRSSELQTIVTEVQKLRNEKYSVTVNIFAQNKFNQQEGVNWSYWENGKAAQSEQTALFTTFVYDLKQQNVRIGLFDSRE